MTVAPTGNRLRNDTGDTGSALVPEEQFGEFRPGENARDVVHPAAYDDVLAVNASMAGTGGADPHLYVLENSATDLAAPTAGGVSYTVNGGTCVLSTPATSWAAAEVSGVLALLFAHFPGDTPAMAVNRLLATADGRPDIPNRLSGAGDVQPYDALTRPLAMDADGVAQQTAPEPDTQVYAPPSPSRTCSPPPERPRSGGACSAAARCCSPWCCGRCWRGGETAPLLGGEPAPCPTRENGPSRTAHAGIDASAHRV